jgi:nicotinamide-nucleotide amidase
MKSRKEGPMFAPTLTARAAALIARYASLGMKIATAESCTGGLVAGLLTEIPGSSAVVERGFVTYSNDAKRELLGVPAATLEAHGAVSEATARAMAQGALARSHAQVSVSVTGVAGPDGGTAEKPVGLVHFACAGPGAAIAAIERRFGDLGRSEIRTASVEQALELLERAALSLRA